MAKASILPKRNCNAGLNDLPIKTPRTFGLYAVVDMRKLHGLVAQTLEKHAHLNGIPLTITDTDMRKLYRLVARALEEHANLIEAPVTRADEDIEMPDAANTMPTTDCEMTDADSEIPNPDREMPDADIETPNLNREIPDADCEMPDASSAATDGERSAGPSTDIPDKHPKAADPLKKKETIDEIICRFLMSYEDLRSNIN